MNVIEMHDVEDTKINAKSKQFIYTKRNSNKTLIIIQLRNNHSNFLFCILVIRKFGNMSQPLKPY